MDDEFALCWNNFQDNIASGFQNLYDRGDLVDVTLACDGRLLHAHKIVLAICSPYFQEIFISNPCKHPIIILKDVTHGVMCELLQFMYQGVVNVKHTELQAFMKIAQLLQIKGLASSVAAPHKSPSQLQTISNATAVQNTSTPSASGSSGTNPSHKHTSGINTAENSNLNDAKNNVPAPSSSSSTSSPSPMPFSHIKSPAENLNPFQTGPGLKRLPEYSTESLSIYSRKQYRRNTDSSEHDMCPDSMDHVNPEDNFLPTIPHISMAERFDPNSVKRENNDHTSSPLGLRNSLPPHFGFDYNIYKNNPDYPSDLHLPNDYSKSFGNHMDIPPIAPGERWFHGKLEFMLSQRGKPLLVHDGHTFGIQYVRKDKKYWQCNLSRKFNCKARVTTTDTGEIIVTNNEHCHTEIRQHLRKDYQRNKVMMNAFINLSKSHLNELHRQQNCNNNLNNFGNINNLSTSSSRVEKDYRPYLEMAHEAINATMSEVKSTSPTSPNTEQVDSNMNTKDISDSPIDVSWKGKNNDSI